MKPGPDWVPLELSLEEDFDLRLSLLASQQQPIDVMLCSTVIAITIGIATVLECPYSSIQLSKAGNAISPFDSHIRSQVPKRRLGKDAVAGSA